MKGLAMNPKPHWEHFPHDADMGVRGVGNTKAEAFEQAAVALTNVVTSSGHVNPQVKIAIACEAPDDDMLLADWLNSVITKMATDKMLFAKFTVHITDHCLHADVWGEKVDVLRHMPAVEVKGATYTALSVSKNAHGMWQAQCVVDV